MKWLSNIYDHRKTDAKRLHYYSSESFTRLQLQEREWQEHLNWINRHIIGAPQATEKYTEQELVDMDMIGIYKQE